MADYPPFMNAYGVVPKVLNLIKDAQTPPRFTQDYLKTLLGYQSGSAEPIIPLMKRIGFLAPDGTPTDLYKRFRNKQESGSAMAEALRKGYPQLFSLKENAHALSREDLEGLITQTTGLAKDSGTVKRIARTFEALDSFADFEGGAAEQQRPPAAEGALAKLAPQPEPTPAPTPLRQAAQEVDMNLSYTINLNLPETSDVAVFNAIFAALKTHLLKR